MFSRATITLGIGLHSSLLLHCNETNIGIISLHHTYYVRTCSLLLPTEYRGLSVGLSH